MWVAAIAGPLPWLTSDPGAGERSLGLLSILSGGFGIAFTVQGALARSPLNLTETLGLMVLLGTWLAFIAPTIFWTARRTARRLPSVSVYSSLRGTAFLLCLLAWTVVATSAPALSAAAFGAAVGLELAVTQRTLGGAQSNETTWIHRLRAYVFSFTHIIVVWIILVFAIFLANHRHLTNAALTTLLFVDIGVMSAVSASVLAARLLRWNDSEIAIVTQQVRVAEFERRGHWLHDDVLGQLTSIRNRVRDDSLHGDELVQAFADADHELRKIQLNQGLETGQRKISHVLQPYIRHARNQGIEVVDVPNADIGDVVITKEVGELLKRSVAGAVNNSVNARSKRLSIGVQIIDSVLELTVDDDGGGGARIISGRGLDDLQRDLQRHRLHNHEGAIALSDIAGGTRFRAVIPT